MQILKTCSTNYVALILRITLGGVMLPHGLQKAFGLFGGPGFEGAMQFLGSQFGSVIAFLVILGESLGALLLILGFLTRFCALSIGVILAGAVAFVHAKNGFFAPQGFEYHLLAMGIALSLVIRGGGAWSVDSLLASKQ